MLLVSVSVGLGLANAARLIPPRGRRALLAVHEQTALAALISIAAHGLLLLPDHWLHPGAAGIAVPFAIGYRPARHRARHRRRLPRRAARPLVLRCAGASARGCGASAHMATIVVYV